MGFLGDVLGTNSGFSAQSANVLQPANVAQAQQGYNQSNAALQQQRAFLAALAGQNGIQNQADVFQQQQALANQFQGVANGTGPNPAQAELNQATGQNVANQAALMAGQRGAGANAGLLSRQIANQGAATQQQAAGQGATLQAQQQLAALQALQGQQAQLANTAGQQVGQQQQGLGQFIQGASANQNAINNQINAQNQANVGMVSNTNNANAGISAGNAKNQAGLVGGLIGGAGAALGLAHGGSVPGYADGGSAGPQSFIGKFSQGLGQSMGEGQDPLTKGFMQLGQGIHKAMQPATSPLLGASPIQAPQMNVPDIMTASDGGKVPGKARVFGDSQANDTVPAKLSPGEIVIPRSVLQSDDPIKAASEFVAQELRKHQGKSGKMAAGGMTGETVDDPNENIAMGRVMGSAPQQEAPLQEIPQPAPQVPEVQSSGLSGEMQQQPSPQNSDPYGYGQYLSGMQKVIGAQQAGISQEAAAQGALGQQQAGVEHERQAKLQEQAQSYQQNYNKLDGERQAFMKDVQDKHIDPNHYVGSMESGKKLRTAIGLILGGIGGGLMGQENPALKFLNSQIDRDIEAQKVDMGKKENLLSMNMKQFGNMNEAMNMTRVQMLDLANSQIAEAAAKSQDPLAKARALQASGQLSQTAAPILQQIAMKKTMMSGAQNGNPGMVIRSIVPEGQQQSAFKELKEAQDLNTFRQTALNGLEQIAKLNTLKNRAGSPIQSSKQIKTIKGAILPMLAKDTSGKYTESDAKALEHIFDTLGADEKTIAKGRQQLNKLFLDKGSFPQLDSYGINPMGKGRFDMQGESRIKMGPPKI